MVVDTPVTVPVNFAALTDDGDFKTREESVAYNAGGLDLVWNFVTPGGVQTQTAVTPTNTGGSHDWVNVGNGMYNIEIPASGGTINNDTEGCGWFTGFATGILPWVGPVIEFGKANAVNSRLGTDRFETDLREIGGAEQSATDLKDFADDGYNPASHKVNGVVLVDTTTTNSDMRGTDNAATSANLATAQADLDILTGADGATLASTQPNYAPAIAGNAMTLTSGEREAIANEVESEIIDETDSEKVLTAITDKIASVNPSLGDLTLAAIAAQVRTELATELARIDVAISTRLASGSYSAPPSAATVATQVRTELATELARIDAAISSRLASAGYTAPDNSSIATILADLADGGRTDLLIDAIKLQTDKLGAAVPDSIPANGSRPDPIQAIYMLVMHALNRSVSGTTATTKKADGSTTLFTQTLDDATSPTSVTRAS